MLNTDINCVLKLGCPTSKPRGPHQLWGTPATRATSQGSGHWVVHHKDAPPTLCCTLCPGWHLPRIAALCGHVPTLHPHAERCAALLLGAETGISSQRKDGEPRYSVCVAAGAVWEAVAWQEPRGCNLTTHGPHGSFNPVLKYRYIKQSFYLQ